MFFSKWPKVCIQLYFLMLGSCWRKTVSWRRKLLKRRQRLKRQQLLEKEANEEAAAAEEAATAEEAAAAEDSWRDTLLLSTDKLSNNFCQNGSAA